MFKLLARRDEEMARERRQNEEQRAKMQRENAEAQARRDEEMARERKENDVRRDNERARERRENEEERAKIRRENAEAQARRDEEMARERKQNEEQRAKMQRENAEAQARRDEEMARERKQNAELRDQVRKGMQKGNEVAGAEKKRNPPPPPKDGPFEFWSITSGERHTMLNVGHGRFATVDREEKYVVGDRDRESRKQVWEFKKVGKYWSIKSVSCGLYLSHNSDGVAKMRNTVKYWNIKVLPNRTTEFRLYPADSDWDQWVLGLDSSKKKERVDLYQKHDSKDVWEIEYYVPPDRW